MAKKKHSLFSKLFILLNNLLAIALIASFFLPYIPPRTFGLLSLLSLFVPILIIVNIFFLIYWILRGFKKYMLLSLIALTIGYFVLPKVYAFGKPKEISEKEKKNTLTLFTYNVRKFNKFNWMHTKNVDKKIDSFITRLSPDIVAIQEHVLSDGFQLDYPYSYGYNLKNKTSSGLAIYSKYPIIKKKAVPIEKAYGRILYVDIVKNNDTLRIYTFHLESLGMNPSENYLEPRRSGRLIKRMRYSFMQQQTQIEFLNQSIKDSPYPVVLLGDMNNTAYSWAYKNLKNDFNDTFLLKGKGFGRTYRLKGFPLRIDYIFTDKNIEVLSHENFNDRLSDHYPVTATIAW